MKANKSYRLQNPATAKKRLLYCLLVFFIGISLPVYFLLHKVYSQLENESWYRQRNQAEMLVERIERKLLEKLQPEQDRPIAEYSFFNVIENPLLQSISVNISPLSELPAKSNIPGLVGYFQIDPDGSFHIPALPKLNMQQEYYLQSGLSVEALASRIKLKQRLHSLLLQNEAETGYSATKSVKEFKNDQEITQNKQERSAELMDSSKSAHGDGRKAFLDRINSIMRAESDQSSVTNKYQAMSEEELQQFKIETSLWELKHKQYAADANAQKMPNQEYRLQSRKEMVKIPDQSTASEFLGHNRKRLPAKQNLHEKKNQTQATANSEEVIQKPDNNIKVVDKHADPLNILSFESEVSAFQIIRLAGSHLCFYRSAWNGKTRYIQGFVVSDLFLKGIVQAILDTTQSLPLSRLILIEKGKVLQQFMHAAGEQELLLFRRTLASPFQQMEIIVNTGSLKIGSSKPVLDMVSIALVIIIAAGFILFYRLGAGQIELAKQQRNFTSSISHELKTPLTSIRMYSEMLRSGWVADESRQQSYYDYIFFESERLSRLISNVLQLAKLDNHQDNIHLITANANQLLQQVRTRIAAQIEAANFQLNLIPAENAQADFEVTVDEDAFFQIMINLVDNAIKFSKYSDIKTIDVGHRMDDRNKQLIFYVRDYGPGVEKEQMKKIFHLFYRAGDELTRKQPGTGIGLALVVQLADSMGATVDLINRNPGVEFQVKCIVK